MKLKFQEYQTRKLVNVHKHVDGGWFWDKYSAHPCVGCRFGCEFCYCRSGRYLGRRDPATFDTHIRVKLNAADRLIRELCRRHGLADRLPRYIPPGPLATNKRVAERLFLAAYDLELEEAASRRIWAYRKAAWTVDELEQPLDELYKKEGEAGLRALPAIGTNLAARLAGWLEAG